MHRLLTLLALLAPLVGCATPDQLFVRGHYAAARLALERSGPRTIASCILLSKIYCHDRAFDHAAKVIRDCDPSRDVALREQLGIALYHTDIPPPQEAIAVLEEVATTRPESTRALMQLATYYARSHPSRAADYLLQYLAHRPAKDAPSDLLVREQLMRALLLSRRWVEASRLLAN